MRIIRSPKQMSDYARKAHLAGKSIGFVPTMGYLHEGHLSLARQAGKDTDLNVMSIFVNPAQFAPQEDLKKYPRDLKRDTKLAAGAGVDIIFYPSVRTIYPDGYKTYVEVSGLSDILCGRSRPGHFRGVATVVTKLFNIVSPDIAYFGKKDAQQAFLLKKMVQDLNMPLRIKVMPIVREKDGLAMSSRNKYLLKEKRQDALVLSGALFLARQLIRQGKKNTRYLAARMRELILRKKTARIDYIEFVNARDFSPVRTVKGKVLVALAVWIGQTRLIDNMVING